MNKTVLKTFLTQMASPQLSHRIEHIASLPCVPFYNLIVTQPFEICKGAELTRSTSAYALPLFQPRPESSGVYLLFCVRIGVLPPKCPPPPHSDLPLLWLIRRRWRFGNSETSICFVLWVNFDIWNQIENFFFIFISYS